MNTIAIAHTTVPVREYEVTTRVTGEDVGGVEFAGPGLIVESLLGRYILDRDARQVWFRIDGRRSAQEVVETVAVATGRSIDEVRVPVLACLDRLRDLALIRYE